MAGRKLTELTTTESLSSEDLVYVVDIDAATGLKSKGITKANLAAQMGTSVASTEPVENEYADISTASPNLLGDQSNQTTSFLQYVLDDGTGSEAYYEKLATSTADISDYRKLSDTEVEVVRDSNSYRVFRIEAIQDEGTPITTVAGGRISFEYSGANVTAILFNRRYTDAILEFYGKDVNVRFYNRATRVYQTEAVASGAWTTVNTNFYRAAVTGTNIQIADLTVDNRVEFFIVEGTSSGTTTATSKTGTSIVFTENALYNEATYLTSGALTLDLTGAVKDTYCAVYCNGYAPAISGEDYFISSGVLNAIKLNILSFYYDGTKIYLNIGNVDTLTAPTLTLTEGDTELIVNWSAITDADNYVIERADDSGFTTNLTEIYSGALLTYTNTGLTNGQTYYFRGKAQGGGFIESSWSATVSDSPEVASFWSSRVPPIGYSIYEKLNSSATAAFSVTPNSDGTGTETNIGFDGNFVDLTALAAVGSDLYIKTIFNQGTEASMDLDIGANLPKGMTVRSAGVTTVKNGIIAGFTNGDCQYAAPTAYAPLAVGSASSVHTVTASAVGAALRDIFVNTASGSSGMYLKHDTRSTVGRQTILAATGGTVNANLNTPINNTDQRIMMSIKTASDISAWNDNLAGDQNVAYSGTSTNDRFNLLTGISGGTPFNGYFQHFTIYASDIGTTEREAIRDHLNTIYTIY